MGFPSPADDYVMPNLTPEYLCGVSANSLTIETSSGYAVIERTTRFDRGDILLASLDGHSYFGKWMGSAFITEDGEAIEGDELDNLVVIGVLTFSIDRVKEDSSPTV